MAIVCTKCKQEVNAGILLGHLVAKGVKFIGPYVMAYYVQKYSLQLRTWSDQAIGYLVGTANDFEIPCSVCGKHKGWIIYENKIEGLSEAKKQSEE